MRDKYSKLLGNSLIFAVANIGSKMIQFFLVPIYTYALSKASYGTVDLIMTTVNMLTPIFSLSIFDAVFRFTMDKESDKGLIFSAGFIVTIIGSIIVLAITPVFSFFRIPFALYFSILLILALFLSLIQNFAKSLGYVKSFAFAGIINALATLIFSVLFLITLNLGIRGYIYSLVLGSFLSLVYLLLVTRFWKYFSFSKRIFYEIPKLLSYSIPLIPNAFSWWFTNDANRFFILFFVGVSGNGLYAVANKIPSLLSVLFSVFSQAWELSAVEEYSGEKKNTFYSNVFKYLCFISALGFCLLLLILRYFMRIYTSPSFYLAWELVPFLLLAAIYSNLSAFVGTIFLAAKRTGVLFSTTILGMIFNLVLNLALIPIFGVNGAGIGSSLGFFAVLLLRLVQCERQGFASIDLDKKNILLDHIIIFLMIIFEFTIKNDSKLFLVDIVLVVILLTFNKKEIVLLFSAVKGKLRCS